MDDKYDYKNKFIIFFPYISDGSCSHVAHFDVGTKLEIYSKMAKSSVEENNFWKLIVTYKPMYIWRYLRLIL